MMLIVRKQILQLTCNHLRHLLLTSKRRVGCEALSSSFGIAGNYKIQRFSLQSFRDITIPHTDTASTCPVNPKRQETWTDKCHANLKNWDLSPKGTPRKKDGGECFAPLVRSLEEPWNDRTHEIFGLGLSLKGRALRSNLGTLHF